MHAKFKHIGLLVIVLALIASLSLPAISSAQSISPPPKVEFHLFFPISSLMIPPDWLGPDGGLISAVVFNRQDPAVLYAGSWGGGVYKSSDGGGKWERASQGLGNQTVVSLAIDPSNPEILYAGTYRGKIWKSIDAGETWFLASEGIQENAIVYSIVIDPQNAQRIFAATRGYSQNDRPWAGVVYRSGDGGASWTISLDDLGGDDYQDWVYALAINPNRPNTIFGASHEHGPIRSSDDGKTWRVLTNGITNRSTRAVVIDPRKDYVDTVYTGVWTKSGVFKSDDGGGTWTLKDAGISGANIYGMSINPFAPKTIFAATYNMGVMRTTNGANSWSSTGLKSDGIATVQVNPTNGQIVYSGTAGDGLYVSADGGSNWRHSQDHLQASDVTDLVVSSIDPAVYYASINGGGMMSSPDQGQTWTSFSPNLDDHFINGLVRRPGQNVLFALAENEGLYRCDLSDLNACWQKISLNTTADFAPTASNNIPVANYNSFLQAYDVPAEIRSNSPGALSAAGAPATLRFAPSNTAYAYLGTKDTGVFRSADGGASWAQSSWTAQNVWSLAVDPVNPLLVTGAADVAGVINQSNDGGNTWASIGIPGVVVYALEAAPSGQNQLWAGASDGIYSFNNGQWNRIGLAGQTVLSLAIYPGKDNLLFAGTTAGVWISKDSGNNWREGPPELTGIPVQSIAFDPHDSHLIFYCTSAHGILRAHLDGNLLLP